MKHLAVAFAGFCWFAAATVPARAQSKSEPGAEPEPAASMAAEDRRGFELMLRPGYGSAGDKSPVVYEPAGLAVLANPPGSGDVYGGKSGIYGGGFAGDVSAGYRFLPFMSAGVYAEMRSSSAKDPKDDTTDLSRSAWGTGFYVRGYLPTLHEKIDPWVSLGVGYVQDTQTYKRAVTGSAEWTLRHHGVAVPLGLGVDYRVADFFAVGPSFRYSFVNQAGGCLEVSAQTALGSATNKQCTDADEFRRITKTNSYGAWSVGLDLRLTLH